MHLGEIDIRPLTREDAALFRDIRLEGLRRHPEAFGSTYESESAKTLTWFSDRLGNSRVFGAFDGSLLQGIAGFAIRRGDKEAHKGLLWGMYVRREARGAGVARRLVEAVIDFARTRVDLIQLRVVVGNEAARRLYEKSGFVEYGTERRSLRHDGKYYDEILMAMDLVPGTARETERDRLPQRFLAGEDNHRGDRHDA